MEFLFAFQSVATFFGVVAAFVFVITIFIYIGLKIAYHVGVIQEGNDSKDTKSFLIGKNITRNICIISIFLSVLLLPISNATDTYKKILIYRGVNSVLVDKAFVTADKALDLLNQKIEEQVNNHLLKEVACEEKH